MEANGTSMTDDPGGAVAWRPGRGGSGSNRRPWQKTAADAGSWRSLADDPGGADAEQKLVPREIRVLLLHRDR